MIFFSRSGSLFKASFIKLEIVLVSLVSIAFCSGEALSSTNKSCTSSSLFSENVAFKDWSELASLPFISSMSLNLTPISSANFCWW